MTELPTTQILMSQFLMYLQLKNRSDRTVHKWSNDLNRFMDWCHERGIEHVTHVTAEILAAYRRHLFHHRIAHTGRPLKFSTQVSYLTSVCRWFKWLAKQQFMPTNIADDFEYPRSEQRLPAVVLTADEVERLLNATDVTTLIGLRDRALLETFYSTGIRASELANLQVYDLETDRGVLKINQGKGSKDRVVPIGQRAMQWIDKYTADARPLFVTKTNQNTLFVSSRGRPLGREHLSCIVRGYLNRAGITKAGSCHLLRHTTATLMMHNGAGIRAIQELLGHTKLSTTQIYTHVTITDLKRIHSETHPAEQEMPPTDDK